MDFHLAFVVAELDNGLAMVRRATLAYALYDPAEGDAAREAARSAHSAALRSMEYIKETDRPDLQAKIDVLEIAIDGLNRPR